MRNKCCSAKKAVWLVGGFVVVLVAICIWLAECRRSED